MFHHSPSDPEIFRQPEKLCDDCYETSEGRSASRRKTGSGYLTSAFSDIDWNYATDRGNRQQLH